MDSLRPGTRRSREMPTTPMTASLRLEDGELGRQAPAGFPRGVPVHVQVVHDRLARAQDLLVLLRIDLGQVPGEDLEDRSPQQLVLVFEPAALNERLVDRDITALAVFNQKAISGTWSKMCSTIATSTDPPRRASVAESGEQRLFFFTGSCAAPYPAAHRRRLVKLR